MLHILWVIIRFILILLGVLFGLLLLAVFLLLFCPVKYRVIGSLEEDNWKKAELTAGVSWLFHAISLTVKKHGSETGFSIHLFGIPLDKLIFRKNKNKEDLPGSDEMMPVSSDKETDEKSSQAAEMSAFRLNEKDGNDNLAGNRKDYSSQTQNDCLEKNDDQENKAHKNRDANKVHDSNKKHAGLISAIQGKLKEISEKLKNLSLTIRRFRGKIGWYQELWNHPRTQEVFRLVKQHAMFLLKHILPTKIEGKVTFGFENPAITGSVLGILGMTIPFHKNCVEVIPVFEAGNLLRGNIRLKGRIYGVVLARAALVIYFNKNVKYVMKHWKHKEG